MGAGYGVVILPKLPFPIDSCIAVTTVRPTTVTTATAVMKKKAFGGDANTARWL